VELGFDVSAATPPPSNAFTDTCTPSMLMPKREAAMGELFSARLVLDDNRIAPMENQRESFMLP
jgi:hypothetical protein